VDTEGELLEPDFLELEDVLELHDEVLRRHGGQPGVRDLALLESAVAMPRGGVGEEWFHPDLWSMAAAYAFHIAENQPFLDGNKRTAIGAALVFLDLNGASISSADQELYDAMIGISARTVSKSQLATLLRRLALETRRRIDEPGSRDEE
jgi:death-on-curing protein